MKRSLKQLSRQLIGRRGDYFHYQKGAKKARPLSVFRTGTLFLIIFALVFTSFGGGIIDQIAGFINKEFLWKPRPLVANAKIEGTPGKPDSVASIDDQDLSKATKDELAQAQEEIRAIPPATKENAQPKPRQKAEQKTHLREDTTKRDEFSTEYVNTDGSRSLVQSMSEPLNYQANGKWEKIVPKAQKDEQYRPTKPIATSQGLSAGLNPMPQLDTTTAAYDLSAGNLKGKAKPFADGVSLTRNGQEFTLQPVNGRNVKPTLKQLKDGTPRIIYEDAWDGVDVFYTLSGSQLKEELIIKRPTSQTEFAFTVAGGTVTPHPEQAGAYVLEKDGVKVTIPATTVAVKGEGVLGSEPYVIQKSDNGKLTYQLNAEWLKSQKASAYPIVVDPTLLAYSNDYQSLKGDGSICWPGQGCGQSAGKTYTGTVWRFRFKPNYNSLEGKYVYWAALHLKMFDPDGIHDYGTYDVRTLWARAMPETCTTFSCADNSFGIGYGDAGLNSWVDVTTLYKNLVDGNAFGRALRVDGEENNNNETFKMFDPGYTVLEVNYVTPSPKPTVAPDTLGDGASVITPQPELKVNKATDPEGRELYYQFKVATGRDGDTNVVANSGWLKEVNKWTVPDGVLQDGVTYYWRVYTWTKGEDIPQGRSDWVRSFRYDLRTGKDDTQSFDTAGSLSVNLANGNLITSASGHSSSALGGSLGVSMDYNSPYRSRQGLTAEYWNQSGTTFPTTPAAITRVETNIDNDWSDNSPHPGIITKDNFMARWSGYFVAPATGNYQFGAKADDRCRIKIDGQTVTEAWDPTLCNNSSFTYGSSVSLTEGQVVPISVEYAEITGNQNVQIKVKGAVPEQIIPTNWLQTGVKSVSTHGLVGRYFEDKNNHTFPTNEDESFLVRTDAQLNMRWDAGSPVASGPQNDFMARWSGYFTAPTAGSYTFGVMSDDGVRIKINDNTTYEKWRDSQSETGFGTSVTLSQGQTVPIVVEYYEHGGGAAIDLLYKLDGGNEQLVPSSWLSPKAQVLPDGWTLGVDPDGDLGYDRLKINQASVTLTDSTGETHEYKFENGGYKPPAGEDGQIIRNSDASYTMTEASGRTYIFDQSGKLVSTSTPLDDKKPAALKYEYTGSPSKLTKIVDGVTTDRFMSLHYSGDSECSGAPSGFDSAAPAGMLCALKTNDGRKTNLWYKSGQLSRMSEPGDENTDWGYDTLGRIVQVRDPLASDAIAAGVRAQDDTVTTQVTYDVLGRVNNATMPAPTTGANRSSHTYDYFVGSTKTHVSGATEPNGFSRKITYDATLRTTADTDIANLTDTTEWDAVKDMKLSSTDETGLKSTTIYDDEDRPVSSYGPAPTAWFGTDRKPLSGNAAQTPRTDTNYDEGLVGPALTWYNTRRNSKNEPYFYGAPKARSTNFPGQSGGTMIADFRTVAPPVTVESGNDSWGYSATGKMRFPQNGTYLFNLWHDDGVRVWVNDQLVLDDWTYVGDTQKQLTGSFTAEGGKPYRFRFDFANKNSNYLQDMWLAGPGISDQSGTGLGTRSWPWLTPDYSLTTSTKTYDSTIGDVTTATGYNGAPEIGQATTSTLDPTGLNYTTASTYEAQGATGSFMRQTSKALPGSPSSNPSFTYSYYGATETRDNPCTPATETYRQGGMQKLKTEADPDGAGTQTGRATEMIYDDSGATVATRYNNEAWTCTEYDGRGRIGTINHPAIGNEAARTVTNDWAVNGDPLVTTTWDNNGWVVVWTDLLGRTTKYRDVYDDETTTTYDNLDRMVQRVSPLGTEVFEYDSYNRLTNQKLDGVTYAAITYDQYGRIDYIDYPNAAQQKLTFGRDSLGRTNSLTYRMGDGTTQVVDNVTRSQSGQILTNVTTSGSNQLYRTYGYDKADRLVSADIGPHTYSYGFGAQDGSCGTGSGTNPNSGKNGNRTSQTINGVTRTFCYDYADRLTSSSDSQYNSPQYDSRGNITQIGTDSTPLHLFYDSRNRSTGYEQYDGSGNGVGLYYDRDVQGRIIGRYKSSINSWNWASAGSWFYHYTGVGDTPDYVRDGSWNIIEKNLTLPGGVLLTLKPQETQANNKKQYLLPNVHGDTLLMTNAVGSNTSNGNGPASSFTYDPYGNILPGSSFPANTGGASYAYVGQHQKFTENSLTLTPIPMGSRVYLPGIGRFTQVDPVEGGVENNYVYPPDPVNEYDLDGNSKFSSWVARSSRSAGKWAWNNKGTIALTAATFVPGVGGVAVAARAFQIARAAKIGKGAYSLGKSGKLTSAIAGRMYVGRGARTIISQGRKTLVSADGLRRYRVGVKQSGKLIANFERRINPAKKWNYPNRVANGHLRVKGWLW